MICSHGSNGRHGERNDRSDAQGNRWALLLFFGTLPLLWGSYLLLVYPPSMVELPIGVGAAVLAALALAAAYRVLWPGYRLPPRLVSQVARLPTDVLRDLGTLTRLLAVAVARRQPLSGAARWTPLLQAGTEAGTEAAARGRRLATELLASAAPNTVAVGFDGSGRRMLVHEMCPAVARASDEEAA